MRFLRKSYKYNTNIYVGNFNDPVKTRQTTESLISSLISEVIISGVNLGNYELFRAVQNADRQIYITTTYTNKHYIAST
ncbi:MAG TPA: hypothetical protein VKN64_00425 [Halanaerobiales bacterium]|nr:hypothetical protein [Halanaerobiales bacterium]